MAKCRPAEVPLDDAHVAARSRRNLAAAGAQVYEGDLDQPLPLRPMPRELAALALNLADLCPRTVASPASGSRHRKLRS